MGNPVTDILKIKYPIIQGGMGNISDPGLAAAVSNAGGLGTIGAGTLSVDALKEKIDIMLSLTDQPVCVNIPITVHPDPEAVARALIELKIPVVSLSAGNPAPFIDMFKKYGIKVICVTSTVRQAKKAEKHGADLVVCEGYEAAGLNSPNESTSLTLIPQVVKAVDIPVIAAGGIADGKGLAAVFALGATGVQMGTRLVATKEAGYHPAYKQAILEANDEATVIVGRKFKKIRRILKNEYAEKLLHLEKENADMEEYEQKTSEEIHKIGAVDGDPENGFMTAGQIAGLIDDLPTVKQLFERMMKEAEKSLEVAGNVLLSGYKGEYL